MFTEDSLFLDWIDEIRNRDGSDWNDVDWLQEGNPIAPERWGACDTVRYC